MRRLHAALLTLVLGLAGSVPATAIDLSEGDPAPPFELKGSDSATYTLEGLLAKHQGVVLAWFPKAFTPG